jgi:hypothetical protein
MLRRGLELTDEVRDAYIYLWEARAVALMGQPLVWAAVESVVSELEILGGVMGRDELNGAIIRGLRSELVVNGEFQGPHILNQAPFNVV